MCSPKAPCPCYAFCLEAEKRERIAQLTAPYPRWSVEAIRLRVRPVRK